MRRRKEIRSKAIERKGIAAGIALWGWDSGVDPLRARANMNIPLLQVADWGVCSFRRESDLHEVFVLIIP